MYRRTATGWEFACAVTSWEGKEDDSMDRLAELRDEKGNPLYLERHYRKGSRYKFTLPLES